MSNIEQGGGVSDGERAEAEKFNAMVDEGKLTPAEASQVEKDKTPQEVEAEKFDVSKPSSLERSTLGVLLSSEQKYISWDLNLSPEVVQDKERKSRMAEFYGKTGRGKKIMQIIADLHPYEVSEVPFDQAEIHY